MTTVIVRLWAYLTWRPFYFVRRLWCVMCGHKWWGYGEDRYCLRCNVLGRREAV